MARFPGAEHQSSGSGLWGWSLCNSRFLGLSGCSDCGGQPVRSTDRSPGQERKTCVPFSKLTQSVVKAQCDVEVIQAQPGMGWKPSQHAAREAKRQGETGPHGTPWCLPFRLFGNSSWRSQNPVDRCLFENERSLRLISVFGRRVLMSRVYPSSVSSSYYYFCPLSICQCSLYSCLWGRGCFLELIVLVLQLQLLSKNIIWKYL